LLFFTGLLLIPLFISCAIAVLSGESYVALLSLCMIYCLYLSIWALLTILFSSVLQKRTTVLATLIGLWFGFSLLLPSMAVNVTNNAIPIAGKIETDLNMLADVRKVGDGHNANDPAFKQLRKSLLEKYNVEKIEDLPINFRGMVAIDGEEKLTKILNEYADSRMASELLQEQHLANYAWFVPTLIKMILIETKIKNLPCEHV